MTHETDTPTQPATQSKSLAFYILLAVAFFNGGLLVMLWQAKLPAADAEMVVHHNGLSMLTARTASDDESLFVVDNANQTLLIYNVELRGNRGDLELSRAVRLSGGGAGGGAMGGTGGRTGR